jgi:hypothetical protein
MSSKDYIIVKDGEMVHFKYIKRERVNGEWRYYYDKGSIGRSIKKAVGIDARDAYRSARDSAVAAENERKEAHAKMLKESGEANATRAEAEAARKEIPNPYKPSQSNMQTALEKGAGGETTKAKVQAEAKAAQAERNKAIAKADAYSKVASKQAKEAAEASRQNSAAAVKSQAAQMAAEEALKKYYKTPLGSLKFLSDKGKELLYKIF